MMDEHAMQQQLPVEEAAHGKRGVTHWRQCPNCGKPVLITTSQCGWCGQYLLRENEPGQSSPL